MKHPKQTRSHETRVELNAPIPEVWKALTTGEGLKQWFGLDAKDAKPGGNFFVSWSADSFIDAPITVFKEHQHLRVEMPMSKEGEAIQLAVDFHLGTEEGRTVLRIVTSGFGVSAQWDDEFDGMLKGWEIFATNIQHYLGRQLAKRCRSFGFPMMIRLPRQAAWDRLTGPQGFNTPKMAKGDAVELATGWGQVLGGKVDILCPPATFGLILRDWNDALLRFELNGQHTPIVFFNVMVLAWDESAERMQALEQQLRAGIEALFQQYR